MVEIGEGDHKVQIHSCKTSKSQENNVQHGTILNNTDCISEGC